MCGKTDELVLCCQQVSWCLGKKTSFNLPQASQLSTVNVRKGHCRRVEKTQLRPWQKCSMWMQLIWVVTTQRTHIHACPWLFAMPHFSNWGQLPWKLGLFASAVLQKCHDEAVNAHFSPCANNVQYTRVGYTNPSGSSLVSSIPRAWRTTYVRLNQSRTDNPVRCITGQYSTRTQTHSRPLRTLSSNLVLHY
jgi:hypothetical protein